MEVKELEAGVLECNRDGGISMGTSFKNESIFKLGDTEVEFWLEIERFNLRDFSFDFKKLFILFVSLNCFEILL